MKRKTLTRIIVLVVLLSLILTSAVFAMPPGQLKKLQRNDSKYSDAENYVKLFGIMQGYGNGKFGLEDFVKRGDIVVMIVRAFKLSMIMEKYQIEIDDLFPDVDKDSYFAKDISVAKILGIAKGYGNGFKPHKSVSIEEAILLIERSVAHANSNVKVYDVDLRDLYNNDDELMSEPARRKDIALMLYYVLTGDEYDGGTDNDEEEKTDLTTIEYKINEDEIQTLTVRKFTNILREKTNKTLKYVMFEEIKKEENFDLYYNYKNRDSETVDDEIRYYTSGNDNLISKVSFVPDENVTGDFFIKYKAFVEGASYTGKVKVTVNDLDIIDLIEDTIYIDETITYDIEEIFEDEIHEDLESVIIKLPNKEVGKLFFNYNKSNEFEIKDGDKYEYSQLREVTFKPSTVGLYEIIYKVTDDEGETYTGTIKITVNEYRVFKTITLEDDDFEVTFDFMNDILDKVTIKKFEKVLFESPDSNTMGTLYNDYDGDNQFRIRNIRYNISELEELTFMAKDYDSVNINYKVLDKARNEYSGKIIIDID